MGTLDEEWEKIMGKNLETKICSMNRPQNLICMTGELKESRIWNLA